MILHKIGNVKRFRYSKRRCIYRIYDFIMQTQRIYAKFIVRSEFHDAVKKRLSESVKNAGFAFA